MPLKPRTLAVHAGSMAPESRSRPVSPAIEVGAVSYFDSADDLDASLDGKDFVYGRNRSQNAAELEEAVAALEGTQACSVYGSGMAAIRAVFDGQPWKAGDALVIPADGYGASRALLKNLAAERGVTVHSVALAGADAAERIRAARPRLVLAESISNPLLAVPDIALLAQASHAVGAVLAVDGTFASPVLQRPCELGADYAIQSTTKWLNGHSDAMGGAVSGSRERIEPLRAQRVLHGALLGPFEAWLTLRGIRTLAVRMRAHCESALEIARRLSGFPRLERVLYPGLADNPYHATAARVLSGGFGGMVAFEIRGATRKQSFRFLESVRLAKPAPSLGDVTTLVMHPATASARKMTPQERETAGIRENLIRVSVGLEDPEDIAADLSQAIDRAVEVS